MAFHGALFGLTADLTSLTFPVNPVLYDEVIYDTDTIVASDGVFTIPVGFTMAQFTAGVALTSEAVAGSITINLYRNGVEEKMASTWPRQSSTGFTNNNVMGVSPWLPVTAGDDFQIRVNRSGLTGTSILAAVDTLFGVELRA
jgi:hypothetical protein